MLAWLALETDLTLMPTSLLARPVARRQDMVRLSGRVLFLTEDPELIRRQLEGEDLAWNGSIKLRDNISTDEITPAYMCYYFDETLGEFPYLGLKAGEQQQRRKRDEEDATDHVEARRERWLESNTRPERRGRQGVGRERGTAAAPAGVHSVFVRAALLALTPALSRKRERGRAPPANRNSR